MDQQYLSRTDLRVYQTRAVEWIKTRLGAGLFLDMGLGKTISTLTAIVDFLASGDLTGPVFIVGPIRVITNVWRQEAAKWSHTQHLTFSLVHGTARQRLKALGAKADIYLIQPGNLKWLFEDWMLLYSPPGYYQIGMLVIDESSMFKDPSTKRFKILRGIVHGIRRRLILTGTPTPNKLLEVWPQSFIIDGGKRLGSAYTRFRDRYFYPVGYMGYDFEPRPGADEAVYEALKDVVMRLDAKDWLDLPPVINNFVRVKLPDAAMKQYKIMERKMFLKLESGEEVEAVNAAVLSGKCQQIANGALYTTEDRKEWELLHDVKMEALAEIIEEAGGPILVCYQFQHDLARLKKAYPKAPVFSEAKNTVKLENEWNDGKHPVMLLHYQSAGHGLNLQYGGNRMVLFSLTWSLEAHDQIFERIGPARQVGRRDEVIRHYIVAENTVDEAILEVLVDKAKGQRELLDVLRRYAMEREAA